MKKIFLSEQNKNNRGEKNSSSKKSFNFNLYKDNVFHSLKDVEHFLNNFQHYSKYFKLYKIIKK